MMRFIRSSCPRFVKNFWPVLLASLTLLHVLFLLIPSGSIDPINEVQNYANIYIESLKISDVNKFIKDSNDSKGGRKFHTIVDGISWAFSAYYDARLPNHVVKIIGISHRDYVQMPLLCLMWYSNATKPEIGKVDVDIYISPEIYRYTTIIYSCHVKNNSAPYSVSLVASSSVSDVIPVINNYKKNWIPSSNFTNCGSVLHSKHNNYKQLVEMIEINSMFGTDHFVFYESSTGPKVHEYLLKYQEEGLVKVVNWTLPAGAEDEVHYYAQGASLNDCFYRNLYKAKYILVTDVDELIIPKTFKTWSDLTAKHDVQNPETCAVLFRNTFFKISQQNENSISNNSLAEEYGINSLLTEMRGEHIYPMKIRSKYIADPTRVRMSGVHQPMHCMRKNIFFDVPVSDALMHHYRMERDISYGRLIRDDSIKFYKDAIITRVVNRHKRFDSTPINQTS